MNCFDSRRLKNVFCIALFAFNVFSLQVKAASSNECIGFYGRKSSLFSDFKQRWFRFLATGKTEKKIKAIFNSTDVVLVKWNENDLVRGDTVGQVPSAVKITRKDGKSSKYYNRTNRGYNSLKHFYPKSLLHPTEMVGKKVLDLAMGGGRYVRELNSWEVEAYGLDVALSKAQLKDIYIGSPTKGADGLVLSPELGEGLFIQADARQTGLASSQFDIIFSTYGMFKYEIGYRNRDPFLLDILQELKRILKVGGVLRISPLFKNDTDLYLKKLVDQIEGLEITEMAPALQSSRPDVVYVEITKIND